MKEIAHQWDWCCWTKYDLKWFILIVMLQSKKKQKTKIPLKRCSLRGQKQWWVFYFSSIQIFLSLEALEFMCRIDSLNKNYIYSLCNCATGHLFLHNVQRSIHCLKILGTFSSTFHLAWLKHQGYLFSTWLTPFHSICCTHHPEWWCKIPAVRILSTAYRGLIVSVGSPVKGGYKHPSSYKQGCIAVHVCSALRHTGEVF